MKLLIITPIYNISFIPIILSFILMSNNSKEFTASIITDEIDLNALESGFSDHIAFFLTLP